MMPVFFHEVSLVNLDCNIVFPLLAANEDYRLPKDSFGLRVDTGMLGDPIMFDRYSF
jgi:hypothetical protein